MSSPDGIYLALMGRVETIDQAGVYGLPISYPESEETFEPPEDGKYLEARYLPNRPAWQSLGGRALNQGLLQINVVWPKNKGMAEPLRAAEIVVDHFPNGLPMFAGGTKVKVTGSPWVAAPLFETDRVVFPVTIPWTA